MKDSIPPSAGISALSVRARHAPSGQSRPWIASVWFRRFLSDHGGQKRRTS